MLETTLRGLLAHKLRLALAAVAVVLGVSFISGTFILGDTIDSTFDRLFAATTQGIDVEVRSVSSETLQGSAVHPPLSASVLETVRGVDGVAEAFGWVARQAPVIGRDGKVVARGGAPSLGLSWNPYPDLSPYRLRAGTAPSGASQVVVDAHTAQTEHLAVGDSIRVLLPQGAPRAFTIAGIVGFGDQDNLAGATVVAFDPAVAAELLGAGDEVDGIDVKAASGVSSDTLTARISRALPAGVEAVTGRTLAQEQSDQVKTITGVLTTFLLVFAFIALFVGSYIIFNTFSILVAQRTRELALLRCLGASRAQVMRSVLLEALVTGAVASAAGVVAGVGIAIVLEALLGALGLDLSGATLVLHARTVIVAMVAGTAVTLVASLFPARRATRVAPVEALRDSEPPVSVVSVRRVAAGASVLAAGVTVMLLGLFVLSSDQLAATGLGALTTFLGVSVLAPVLVVPVMSVLGAPVARFRGVPGQLARENAMRQPRRTAATASALMIGVGLVSCFTVLAASITVSVNRIVDRTVTADLIVSPQGMTGMSPDVAARIAADPAVQAASRISGGPFRYGDETDQATAVEPSTILDVSELTVLQGAPIRSLRDDEIAVGEDAARSHHLAVGDVVPMQLARPGLRRQRVATVYARSPLFGDYVVTLRAWESGNVQVTDFVVAVKGRTGVAAADLRRGVLADVRDFPDVQVQDNAEYKASQAGQVNAILNLLTALVVLAIVIALLGVVNTMALSIVERVRELGLVRALGMTRAQTRSMVRWETVLVTVFGALLGCVVGIFFGVALVRAFSSQGVDTVDLAPGRQAAYLVIAFVAGLGAALWPARRAARVDVLRAVTTE